MLDGAAEWIHRHARDVLSIEVAQQWQLSTVLRVRTSGGSLYFKASLRLPLSADEARLTALLARLYPEHLPKLLATDEARQWLLLGDAGANLRDLPQIELWRSALLRFGDLQRASAAHIDELLAAGGTDWRPARLAEQYDPFLADAAALSGLSAEEAQRLRERAPAFHAASADLRLTSLVHGDFHGGNISCQDEALRVFDWTESGVAHPFFDLLVFLNDAARCFPPGAVASLRDDYLASWSDGAQQWQSAAPLAAFQQALIYNQVTQHLNPDAPRLRVAGWLRNMLSDAP